MDDIYNEEVNQVYPLQHFIAKAYAEDEKLQKQVEKTGKNLKNLHDPFSVSAAIVALVNQAKSEERTEGFLMYFRAYNKRVMSMRYSEDQKARNQEYEETTEETIESFKDEQVRTRKRIARQTEIILEQQENAMQDEAVTPDSTPKVPVQKTLFFLLLILILLLRTMMKDPNSGLNRGNFNHVKQFSDERLDATQEQRNFFYFSSILIDLVMRPQRDPNPTFAVTRESVRDDLNTAQVHLEFIRWYKPDFTLRSDTKLYEFDNYRAPWGDQYNDHHQDADDKYNTELAAETSQLRDYARNLVLNNVLELCEQSSLEANFQDTPDDPLTPSAQATPSPSPSSSSTSEGDPITPTAQASPSPSPSSSASEGNPITPIAQPIPTPTPTPSSSSSASEYPVAEAYVVSSSSTPMAEIVQPTLATCMQDVLNVSSADTKQQTCALQDTSSSLMNTSAPKPTPPQTGNQDG